MLHLLVDSAFKFSNHNFVFFRLVKSSLQNYILVITSDKKNISYIIKKTFMKQIL